MLNAYNNDIEYKSRMYHIQTEDHGIKDAHITTTVFYSGQSLDVKVISYRDAIAKATTDEERDGIIRDMMVNQHRAFYKKLFEGSYESQIAAISAAHAAVAHTPSAQPRPAAPTGTRPISLSSLGLSPGTASGARRPITASTPRTTAVSPATAPGSVTTTGFRKSGLSNGVVSKSVTRAVPVNEDIFSTPPRVLNDPSRSYTGITWPNDDLSIDMLALAFLAMNA